MCLWSGPEVRRRFADANHHRHGFITDLPQPRSRALTEDGEPAVRIAIQFKTHGDNKTINVHTQRPAELHFHFCRSIGVEAARENAPLMSLHNATEKTKGSPRLLAPCAYDQRAVSMDQSCMLRRHSVFLLVLMRKSSQKKL